MNSKISRLGLGTVQFGCDYGFTKAKTQEEVNHILNKCLELGINFIDTARGYGDSEEKIGNFLNKNKRANFFIATKLGKINKSDTENKKSLQKVILNSVENSYKTLGVKKIDLLQLHQEESYILSNNYFWKIIGQLKRDNLISAFGVSVYGIDILMELIKERSEYLDFLQIPYNILDRRYGKIFKDIRSKNIEIISRSVFLKGVLTCSEEKIPEELKEIINYKKKISLIAGEHNFSIEEICLLFALSNENILTTIVGVNSPEELEKNIKTLNKLNKFKTFIVDELKQIKVKDQNLVDPRTWSEL